MNDRCSHTNEDYIPIWIFWHFWMPWYLYTSLLHKVYHPGKVPYSPKQLVHYCRSWEPNLPIHASKFFSCHHLHTGSWGPNLPWLPRAKSARPCIKVSWSPSPHWLPRAKSAHPCIIVCFMVTFSTVVPDGQIFPSVHQGLLHGHLLHSGSWGPNLPIVTFSKTAHKSQICCSMHRSSSSSPPQCCLIRILCWTACNVL